MTIHGMVLEYLRGRTYHQRTPDVIIGGDEKPFMYRWWVIPKNRFFNVYLHQFLRSDDDRALHSHPWQWNVSWLLDGDYVEVMPANPKVPAGDVKRIRRNAGRCVFRWGAAFHRVELLPYPGMARFEKPTWTLFVTGPRVDGWYFACKRRLVHWKDFTGFHKTGTSHEVGPGCGEDD